MCERGGTDSVEVETHAQRRLIRSSKTLLSALKAAADECDGGAGGLDELAAGAVESATAISSRSAATARAAGERLAVVGGAMLERGVSSCGTEGATAEQEVAARCASSVAELLRGASWTGAEGLKCAERASEALAAAAAAVRERKRCVEGSAVMRTWYTEQATAGGRSDAKAAVEAVESARRVYDGVLGEAAALCQGLHGEAAAMRERVERGGGGAEARAKVDTARATLARAGSGMLATAASALLTAQADALEATARSVGSEAPAARKGAVFERAVECVRSLTRQATLGALLSGADGGTAAALRGAGGEVEKEEAAVRALGPMATEAEAAVTEQLVKMRDGLLGRAKLLRAAASELPNMPPATALARATLLDEEATRACAFAVDGVVNAVTEAAGGLVGAAMKCGAIRARGEQGVYGGVGEAMDGAGQVLEAVAAHDADGASDEVAASARRGHAHKRRLQQARSSLASCDEAAVAVALAVASPDACGGADSAPDVKGSGCVSAAAKVVRDAVSGVDERCSGEQRRSRAALENMTSSVADLLRAAEGVSASGLRRGSAAAAAAAEASEGVSGETGDLLAYANAMTTAGGRAERKAQRRARAESAAATARAAIERLVSCTAEQAAVEAVASSSSGKRAGDAVTGDVDRLAAVERARGAQRRHAAEATAAATAEAMQAAVTAGSCRWRLMQGQRLRVHCYEPVERCNCWPCRRTAHVAGAPQVVRVGRLTMSLCWRDRCAERERWTLPRARSVGRVRLRRVHLSVLWRLRRGRQVSERERDRD